MFWRGVLFWQGVVDPKRVRHQYAALPPPSHWHQRGHPWSISPIRRRLSN
jgi:hypothetical protein